MKIIFLGTRGNIEPQSPRHCWHSSLLVVHRTKRVMIDCGLEWAGQLEEVNPTDILITHAHPDHAWGLKAGTTRPVYATAESWRLMDAWPVPCRHTVQPRQPFVIDGLWFEAFELEHSTRCPAVSYRVHTASAAFHYAPDVAYIHDRSEALGGVHLYIGDGSTPDQPLIRSRGRALIGHSPMRTQLTWCAREGVKEAIFTHLGSRIVAGDEEKVAERLRQWASQRGLQQARLAYDGLELTIKSRSSQTVR